MSGSELTTFRKRRLRELSELTTPELAKSELTEIREHLSGLIKSKLKNVSQKRSLATVQKNVETEQNEDKGTKECSQAIVEDT